MTATQTSGGTFYGWRVVGAAFVLAVFGWGMGFYGPPVFLSVVHQRTGWPLALISTAVTTHFLIGAAAGANLPTLYRRFGAAAITQAAALSLAVGTLGWALADTGWQLFAAALLSGAGWGAMSAVAINAIVSPWFAAVERDRIPDACRRNGLGTVRTDWPGRASVLAHDALTGPATGGRRDGTGDGVSNCRPYAGWLDHPARGRPAAGGMCELRRADDRLHGFHCCGGLERSAAVAWDRLVRARLRQFDVIAAAHCAGRIRR